jgi:hypothetical protein
VIVALAVMLGVLALQVHAALPEHHHHQGEKATACVAALVTVAVIVVLRKRRTAPPVLTGWLGAVVPLPAAQPPAIPGRCGARTRAGPLEDSVLRL